MKELLNIHNVSRETISNLKVFQNQVLEYNNKFNLISKTSAIDIWNRHIVDSLQIINLLKEEDRFLYDFGSGAGFPGIVLAIACKNAYPNIKIKLIESIGKKASFLDYINKKMDLNVDVIQERIENVTLPKADVITSRALGRLDKLLNYALPFCSDKTRLIFLKGEKWNKEVEEAQRRWFFKYQAIESITSKEGRILCVESLRRKKTCQK